LDCDDTLWGGVCGEVGPTGLTLDESHLALQRRVVDLQRAGLLVCLCSKNNEADVWDVFRHRPEMPLRPEHLVASRINWQPKSENLRALAAELNLGLDSLVHVDDSPFEIAEIRAQCPEVLAFELPADPAGRLSFVRHNWALDHVAGTSADAARTDTYRVHTGRTPAALPPVGRPAASTSFWSAWTFASNSRLRPSPTSPGPRS
ncbi:MAG: HAD-IIIC family phosphatase, partial [Gemmatimonadales bacterium]